MRHSPSRLLFVSFITLFLVMMVGSVNTTDAQVFPDDFIEDGTLFVYAALDDMNLKDYGPGNPLPINLDAPMELTLQLNATGTQLLNVSGTITFWYQGFGIFPIQIVDINNNTWFAVDPSTPIPPVTAGMDFSGMMSLGPLHLATGVFEATVDFRYYVDGDPTLHVLQHHFEFYLPSEPIDIITSITGIAAIFATGGAVYGVGMGLKSLWDGLQTAYKLRSIQKKAHEIRSLPDLTVLGALPLLFSIVDTMKKKKKEGREDSGVSEYIVRQRLREVAPEAWRQDKCPQCKRKWNTKLNMCKKCNFQEADARIAYADLLSEKVPTAIRWMGKKKSTDVKTLAKKTESTQYNAGVIAAALVDTNVTEITKVGTPFRSFILNIAGLVFVVITWQQLLGNSSSTWLTTLTFVGAGLSLAVIIALYFSRRTQMAKFEAEQEAGKKILPTQKEIEADAESDEETEESEAEVDSEEQEESEEPAIDEESIEFDEDSEPEEESEEIDSSEE
ncbi:MAG: hypothetical protein ACFFE2_00725 [Candidatus Thorarchaeota archaeon]